MEQPIKVVLADDYAMTRQGTRQFLELDDDIAVVAEVSDGCEAVQRVAELHPQVVILDVQMPCISGIEATRQIKAEYPDVHVLILTAYADDPYVFALLQAGADGYMLKETNPADLLHAVRVTAAGGVALGPGITDRVLVHNG